VSRTHARHRKPPRSEHRTSAAIRHRKPPTIVSALQNKPARAVAAAVAGSALALSAWPAAVHWLAQGPQAAGVAQADALGLAPAGDHRGSSSRLQFAASLGAQASGPETVSVAVAKGPGRHRRPASAAYRNPLRDVS